MRHGRGGQLHVWSWDWVGMRRGGRRDRRGGFENWRGSRKKGLERTACRENVADSVLRRELRRTGRRRGKERRLQARERRLRRIARDGRRQKHLLSRGIGQRAGV